jgi:hypothetical protein
MSDAESGSYFLLTSMAIQCFIASLNRSAKGIFVRKGERWAAAYAFSLLYAGMGAITQEGKVARRRSGRILVCSSQRD